MLDMEFYRGKRVLLTGHTGFKGAWLAKILTDAGADVTGAAIEPPTDPNLFMLSGVRKKMHSLRVDVRDAASLEAAFKRAKPEIVLHLAAQPLVRASYADPLYTYETNVMGTVNICECVRKSRTVKSFVNVTTDKVYENREWVWGYREDEALNGYDPYSNSKSCSELVTQSYTKSFLAARGVAVSTARAGNVIGGGDFAADRIVPDCVRAVLAGEQIEVRNPNSTRPYQHVLEPLFAYLMIAQRQYEDASFAGSYNVGPDESSCITTGELAELFCKSWGEGASWKATEADGPHEANFLKLDCSKLKSTFGWKPRWDVQTAVEKTVEWEKLRQKDPSKIPACMEWQIREYVNGGQSAGFTDLDA